METDFKPKGRPKSDPSKTLSARFVLPLRPDQRETYGRAAQVAGLGISEWIRRALDAAADRQLKPAK